MRYVGLLPGARGFGVLFVGLSQYHPRALLAVVKDEDPGAKEVDHHD